MFQLIILYIFPTGPSQNSSSASNRPTTRTRTSSAFPSLLSFSAQVNPSRSACSMLCAAFGARLWTPSASFANPECAQGFRNSGIKWRPIQDSSVSRERLFLIVLPVFEFGFRWIELLLHGFIDIDYLIRTWSNLVNNEFI